MCTPPLILLAAIEATPNTAKVSRAIAFGGLGGAAITAGLIVFGSSVWEPTGMAYWHGLTPVTLEHGPWFVVHVALSYLCLGAATILLVSRPRRGKIFRPLEVATTLTAMSLPWALNGAHLVFGLGGPVDPTPVAFAGTAGLLAWLLRHDPLPRAGRESKRHALDRHPEPYVLAHRDGRVLETNVAGRELLDALGTGDLSSIPLILQMLSKRADETTEVSVRLADGSKRQLEIRVFEIPSLSDLLCGIVLRDVTAQREIEQLLMDQAHFDSLTALPNRRLLLKQLSVGLAMAKMKQHSLGLVLFDLDRFKETNDTLGHDAGDALLKGVAEATQAAVRSRDVVSRLAGASNTSVARLGGDEFVVVLSEISNPEDAADVADRILRSINTPLSILGSSIVPSASVGVAVLPQDGADADALFRAADQALYHAKAHGGNQCQLFHSALNRRAKRRRTIRSELRTALETDQLDVVYQPRIDMTLDTVCGAEALLRWRHPSMGQISPDEFVSVAESSGLAARLGRYVFERVCKDMAHFEIGQTSSSAISVNVTPTELSRPEYFESLTGILRKYGIRPEAVQLEITERVLLEESPTTATNLRDIRGIGIAVYLDDFGTGRSSLSDLLKHRVDGIKLDRAFVSEMASNQTAAGVVRAVMLLASELKLHVVAEGVECAEEAALLRGLGCTQAQGYFWEKGIPAAELFPSLAKLGVRPHAAGRVAARQGS
jgi:diguanylate cyclase (GGDEF)-like protein